MQGVLDSRRKSSAKYPGRHLPQVWGICELVWQEWRFRVEQLFSQELLIRFKLVTPVDKIQSVDVSPVVAKKEDEVVTLRMREWYSKVLNPIGRTMTGKVRLLEAPLALVPLTTPINSPRDSMDPSDDPWGRSEVMSVCWDFCWMTRRAEEGEERNPNSNKIGRLSWESLQSWVENW
jgi:hypothetical protein